MPNSPGPRRDPLAVSMASCCTWCIFNADAASASVDDGAYDDEFSSSI